MRGESVTVHWAIPLTPALSLGERGRQEAGVRPRVPALSAHRVHSWFLLPSARGEGQDEG